MVSSTLPDKLETQFLHHSWKSIAVARTIASTYNACSLHPCSSSPHLYSGLSNRSATTFSNLETKWSGPTSPEVAIARVYRCSSSACLCCSLTYCSRSRSRCCWSLAASSGGRRMWEDEKEGERNVGKVQKQLLTIGWLTYYTHFNFNISCHNDRTYSNQIYGLREFRFYV